MMDSSITKSVKDESAYYTVRWSKLRIAEKFDILKTVPSVAGILELYSVDDRKALNYIDMYSAWYGGLRNALRELVDPTISSQKGFRDLVKRRRLVYRYAASESHADIRDVLFFFAGVRKKSPELTSAPGAPAGDGSIESSGRYHYIYVNEHSPDNLVTI